METLNDTKNKNKIFLMTAVFLLAAAVISFGSTAFADNGAEVASFRTMNTAIVKGSEKVPSISVGEFIKNIGKNTGIYKMIHTETPEEIEAAEAEKAAIASQEAEDPFSGVIVPGWQKLLMLAIGFLIVYLGAAKGFEPLLLIPIGFGTILVNIPGAGMGDAPHGMLHILYSAGVGNEFFPMLIFMGIGAMTDFGPLIANPKMALLGGAAQLGIFATLFGVALMNLIPGVDYNMLQACAIAIIGGADGPTSIYVSGKLAPEMMAVIAVAASAADYENAYYTQRTSYPYETAARSFSCRKSVVPASASRSYAAVPSAGCSAYRYACLRKFRKRNRLCRASFKDYSERTYEYRFNPAFFGSRKSDDAGENSEYELYRNYHPWSCGFYHCFCRRYSYG